MKRFKIGDQVISRPKSAGCAPAGEICRVVKIVHDQSVCTLYRVRTKDGREYRNYEDELDSAPQVYGCDYCVKGKSFNSFYYGDIAVKNYIMGNQINTDIHDATWPDEDDSYITKISYCPFCAMELEELPEEEMEEEIDG